MLARKEERKKKGSKERMEGNEVKEGKEKTGTKERKEGKK